VDGPRLFSLREANGLIELLQREFTRARTLRAELTELQQKLSEAGRPLEGPDPRVDEAAPPSVRNLQAEAVKILSELRALFRQLAELGMEVKGIDGLVDLRTKLHGRAVYLCWKFGEERIEHWHELETGFSGRKPLPEGAEFVGDLLH
jgi:hypothetical protein